MEEKIIALPDAGNIMIETEIAEEREARMKRSGRRFLSYYVALMAPRIRSRLSGADKTSLLMQIVGTLDEEEISRRIDQIVDPDRQAGFVKVLQELVDAYEDEDQGKYTDHEICGNVFSCDRNLDVTPYLSLFESIGNDTQGNRWRVEIDPEGKVVLHE